MALAGRLGEVRRAGAVSLDLLGKALSAVGEPSTAETVLRRAQRRHPGDVWVNYDLAQVLEKLGRRDDAIRFYSAARAVRPETAHELAHALTRKGESDEAIEVFRDLVRLRPGNGRHLACLGQALKDRGRSREAAEVLEKAVAALREAIRLKPDTRPAHDNLGNALQPRESSTRPSPTTARRSGSSPTPPVHGNLGNVLKATGKPAEAVAEYREALRPQAQRGRGPRRPRLRPVGPGKARRGRRRISRGHPARSRRSGGLWQPRRRPGADGEARRGCRPVPRGDPAEAR